MSRSNSVSPSTRAFREELSRYVPAAEAAGVTHVVKAGEGSFYTDVDGKRYLDFSGGIFTNTFGHGDTELAETFAEAYHSLANIHGRHWAGEMELYRSLYRHLPSPDYRVIAYGDGGGYTVDRCEVELYYHFGKRPYRLATMAGGFHGKTQGTKLSVSQTEDAAYFRSFSIPEPNCYRCPCGSHPESCQMECAALAEQLLLRNGAEALQFEPIIGAADIVPPAGYWKRLESFCQSRGILMIADEVLAGGGRVGSYLASAAFDIVPDGIILTKGLANGLPQSLMLLKKELTENPFARREGNYSSTYMGVPALLALTAKVLEKMEREHILDNVTQRGEQLREGLEKIKDEFPEILGDVRGMGLIAAVEVVNDAAGKRPDAVLGRAIFETAEKNGLELIYNGNILRIGPPLNVTAEEIGLGLDILRKSIREALYG